jgi:hypothetical protein
MSEPTILPVQLTKSLERCVSKTLGLSSEEIEYGCVFVFEIAILAIRIFGTPGAPPGALRARVTNPPSCSELLGGTSSLERPGTESLRERCGACLSPGGG